MAYLCAVGHALRLLGGEGREATVARHPSRALVEDLRHTTHNTQGPSGSGMGLRPLMKLEFEIAFSKGRARDIGHCRDALRPLD